MSWKKHIYIPALAILALSCGSEMDVEPSSGAELDSVTGEAVLPLREPGEWYPYGFSSLLGFCLQTWGCVPPAGIWDPACHPTDAESTTGVCAAGNGPPDSCNTCIATPPDTACEMICPD